MAGANNNWPPGRWAEAARGVATETKTVIGPPDGLEVVCVPNASMPR